MKIRAFVAILSLLVCMCSYAQEVDVAVETDTIVSIEESFTTSDFIYSGVYTLPNVTSISNYESIPNLYGSSLTVSPYFFDNNAIVHRIANIGGYVTSTSLPGLMGIESGALSYNLSADNFSFTPAVYVNKYGYMGGLTTSVGVGGQMSFRINDKFSVTAFGAYYTNSWAANPAVMSNMQSSRFGGYGTWAINDRWGLNVGVQRVHNAATNQWQTVPIVMPTFKINGKDAIGIDLGGLLYEMVNDYRYNHSPQNFNPTIGPPVRPQIVIGPRE